MLTPAAETWRSAAAYSPAPWRYLMKALILSVALAASPLVAVAACATHTYFVNGKMVTCTTCCYGSNCTTNCF